MQSTSTLERPVETFKQFTKPGLGISKPESIYHKTRQVSGLSPLYVMGVSGGSGEKTIAKVFGVERTYHLWPKTSEGKKLPKVLLCARTNSPSLMALQNALHSFAYGAVQVELVGTVIIDDLPGKLPTEIARFMKVVSGASPKTWRIGFQKNYRTGDEINLKIYKKLWTDVNQIVGLKKKGN